MKRQTALILMIPFLLGLIFMAILLLNNPDDEDAELPTLFPSPVAGTSVDTVENTLPPTDAPQPSTPEANNVTTESEPTTSEQAETPIEAATEEATFDANVVIPTTTAILIDIPSIENRFVGEVNAHLYAFEGTAGSAITIVMQEISPDLDPFLVLLGPSGEVYVADDDGGETGVSAAINNFALPVDGTYFLLATSNRGLSEGPVIPDDGTTPEPQAYRITFAGLSDIQQANLADLAYTATTIDQPEQVTVSAERPVLYVPISGLAGERVSITTSGEPFAADTLLYLFDRAGNRVAVHDDFERDDVAGTQYSQYAAIQDYVLPESGTYLAFVTTFSFFQAYEPGWSGGGTFTVSVDR